jgi:hypothetical protein
MYYKAGYGGYQENSGLERLFLAKLSTLIFYAAKSCECAQIFIKIENLCSVYEAGSSVFSGNIQDNRCNFSMANLRVETKGTYPILSLLKSRVAMTDRNNI